MEKHVRLTLAIGLALLPQLQAFPSNRYRLPNGFRVPCPEGALGCTDGICQGIGHNTCHGGTFPLNQFGQDMDAEDHKWTKKLCEMDSDGDGLTNGEELGDPCCLFAGWDLPSDYTKNFKPSHPGHKNSKVENYKRPECSDTTPKDKAPLMGKFAEGEVQKTVDLHIDSFKIPMPGGFGRRTHYQDFAWNFDDESADIFHIILAEAIVTTPKNLHHYVVRACTGKWPARMQGRPTNELTREEKRANQCSGTSESVTRFGGWTPGRNILEMPPWAGIAVGKGAGIQSFIVNVHYDNPDEQVGIISTDGMRLHYTPTLRKETLVSFSTMQISANPGMNIPPKKSRYFMTRQCELSIKDSKTGKDIDARILSLGFHAHLLGSEMYAEHMRGDERLVMANDDRWYFDDQYMDNLWLRNISFRTGDILQTTCVFDSSARTGMTVIGLETVDEMCWGIFLFGRGDVDVTCTGPVWTGSLNATESPLEGMIINKQHTRYEADGVWDGSSLESGGINTYLKEEFVLCNELVMMAPYCVQMAQMAPKEEKTCTSTFGESVFASMLPEEMHNFQPIQVCCGAFCDNNCPENKMCKERAEKMTTTLSLDSAPDAKTTTVMPTKKPTGKGDIIVTKDPAGQVEHDVKPGTKVIQVVTLKAIDYDKTMADSTIRSALAKAVKDTFLQQLPEGYTENHLGVAFSKGSVKADVTITPMSDSASATSKMIETMGANKGAMQSTLLKSVQDMPALSKILEEGKSVSDVTVTSTDPVFESVGTVAPVTKPDDAKTVSSHAVKSKVSACIVGWLVAILASASN